MIVGTLEIQLLANMARLQADMDAAKRYVGNTMSSIEGLVSHAQTALNGLTAGFSVGAFTAKLVSVQREFDVLNSSMKTVTGSAAAAEREFAWIKVFAAETPFGLAQATQAFVKMKALGLAPTQSALTSFGNTASAMGKDLNQMIEAVADASTGEFERLKEFGIKASKQGDQVALTFQGITTTIGNSSTEIVAYLEKIGNVDFAGAMAERAATLDGAISALGDSWDGFFRTISSAGASQALKGDVVGLANYLDGVSGAMERAKKSGDGFAMTLNAGLGYAIARVPFDTLSVASNTLNGTINLLTGSVFGLRTNLDLLPDSLQPGADSAAAIGKQLLAAEANLAQLQQKLALVPDNIYLKSETHQAFLLAQQLRAAKQARDDMGPVSGAGGGRGGVNPQTVGQLLDLQTKLGTEMGKYASKAEKANAEVEKLRVTFGAMFTPAMEKTVRESFDTKLPKAAKAIDEAAKGVAIYNDLVAKNSGYSANYAEQLASLSLAASKGALSLGEVSEAVRLIEEQQPGALAAAKAWEEHAKKRYEASSALIKSAVDEADKNEILARTFGMTREAIEQAEIAALEAQLTQKTTIGLCTAETAELEALIAAKKRNSAAVASVDRQKAETDAAKKSAEEWQKGWEETDKRARDAFVGWGAQGADIAKQIGDALNKALWSAIYEVTLKPIAFQIYGSVTGGPTAASAAGSASNGLIGAANTASGLSNLASIGGAGFQWATGSLAGASSASLMGANAVGAVGGDAMGALIAGNGGWAGVSTAAAAGEVGALGTAAGAGSSAGIMSSIGAATPYVLAALAVYSMIKGNGGTPTASTGDASVNFDAAGGVTRRAQSSDYFYGGNMSKQADDFAIGLNKSYLDTAKALGIKAQATLFNYSGNTGKNGESPNFGISGGVIGSAGFNTGEVGYSADAMSLAASRAVFDALQSSELPKYLQGAFDGLTASSMDAKAIADTMASATALKQFHDQLQAMPFAALKDLSYTATASLIAFSGGLDKLGANLGTYYDKFYSAGEKTALLTKNTGAAFESLGLVMPAVNAGLRANYRAMIEGLAAQDMSVAANARAYAGALSLAGAVDQLAPALVDAAKAATDAATAAMGATSKLASDAISGLTKSVAAEKSKLSAIYDTQLTGYTAHLDAVAASVGKLQIFSSSLKSTLDGMRISGSDSTYRLSAQAQISSALATARAGGSLPLDGQLSSALATVSKPSEALFSTFEDYARDFYKTANDISALNDLTGSALTAEQTSQTLLQEQISTLKTGFDAETTRLDALVTAAQAQLDAANGLSTGVLTLADAISGLTEAMQGMTGALISSLSAGSITAPDALAQIKAATGSALAPDAWSTVKTSTGDAKVWASSGGAAALNTATGQQIYGKDGSQFSATDAIASVTANLAASNAAQVYADAIRTGISASSLDALMGWGAGTSNAWAVANGMPKFAAGGDHFGGLRLVGENGPEIEATGPSRIFNAAQTRSMLQSGGANNAEVVAELRALADRLDRIEANTRATAGHTAGTDRKLARVIPGNAVIIQAATA